MENNVTATTEYKPIIIIYLALIIGQVIFLGIAYFLNTTGQMEGPDLPSFAKAIVLILVLAGISISYLVPKLVLKRMKPDSNLSEKLNIFKSAFILRMALFEGSNLILIVYYLLSNEKSTLIVIGMVFLIQFFHFPSKSYASKFLGLNEDEKRQFTGETA